MTIERAITTQVHLTSLEIAAEFWEMDADGQAVFFNALAVLAEDKISMQLQYVTDSEILSPVGRNVMAKIGEYSVEGK